MEKERCSCRYHSQHINYNTRINIPIIGDIFRFLDNGKTGLYDNYKEYSTEMNLSKESKGIRVTINDAIYDGKTVAITYSVESERILGENLAILCHPDIRGANEMAGGPQILKVNDHHYVGLSRSTPSGLTHNEKDTVDIKWNLEGILNLNTQEEINGNSKFAFSLQATDSKVQLSNQSAEQNGAKVTIEKISFIVDHNQEITEQVKDKWHDVDVVLGIKDDLGTNYSDEGNGESGSEYSINISKTFQKLDPNATKLIVTPYVTFRSHDSTKSGGVEFTKDGPKEISFPIKSGVGKEEFVLEDIIIELEK